MSTCPFRCITRRRRMKAMFFLNLHCIYSTSDHTIYYLHSTSIVTKYSQIFESTYIGKISSKKSHNTSIKHICRIDSSSAYNQNSLLGGVCIACTPCLRMETTSWNSIYIKPINTVIGYGLLDPKVGTVLRTGAITLLLLEHTYSHIYQ